MKVNNELCTYHGNLMVIHSQGVFIQGSAGIGKSKLALDLLDRGHQLIADDCIEIYRRTHQLIGRAPKQGRNYLWLPTLGLLDIPLLFGKKAVKKSTPIHCLIKLIPPSSQEKEISRDPLSSNPCEMVDILGVSLPSFSIPIHSHQNLALWVETWVRIQTLSKKHHCLLYTSPSPRDS